MTSLRGSGGSGGGGGGSSGSGGGGRHGSHGGAVQWGVSGSGQMQLQRRQCETLTSQQLREWHAQREASRSTARCPYIVRTGDQAGQTCGTVGHTQSCRFSCLSDAWRAEFGDEAELPRWLELLRNNVDIFALDYDAILTAMYALTVGTEGDCYLCVLPDPGIEAAALAEFLHVPPLFSRVRRFRLAHSQVFTSPRSLRTCMHSRLLVSSLPRSLPPRLPRPAFFASRGGSAPPLTPPRFPRRLLPCRLSTWTCGAQPASVDRAASDTFCWLLTTTRVTGEVPNILIPWIQAVRLQLRERFRTDLPVLRLHSDRGGKFSSDLLRDFCRGESIEQSFMLPASPQQNGIAERRIGLVFEVACTSMVHAAAPHFLWPFAVRYVAHQLNLWPRVSLPETSPTLRWTGEVGDASVFRVWGSHAFVRDTTVDKLSSRAIPCVFLGFPPDAPGWQFYHPTSRRVLSSQDVTFDESVYFYHLFPYHTAPLPAPLPLFLAPGPPPVDPLPPQGPAPSGVSQVDPLPLAEPVEVTGDSGAAGGGAARGAASGGAEPAGAEPGGAEPEREEPGGAEPAGVLRLPGGSLSHHSSCASGLLGAPAFGVAQLELEALELETLELEALELEALGLAALELEALELEALRLETLELLGVLRLAVLSLGGAESGGAEPGGVACTSGLLGAPAFGVALMELEALELEALELEALELQALELEALALEALPLETLELEALELEALALEALELEVLELEALPLETLELEALDLEALELEALALEALELEVLELEALALQALEVQALEPEVLELEALELEALELEVLELEVLELEALCSSAHSPLPAPPRYVEQPVSLIERHEPASRPASPVRTVRRARRIPHPRPPHVTGTHTMALRPSSVLQRVLLPSPPVSSLPNVSDPASDLVRAASPAITRLLATFVTDPSFESTVASALVAELVDFAAACRLDYAASLVAEFESVCPPSVAGECALGTNVLEDRHEDFECLASAVPHLMAWLLAPEGDPDALDIPTPRSYAESTLGPYSFQWQIVMDAEMASWKSTGTYVDAVPPPGANIVDGMWIFRTFSPTPKMTTLRVLLHVAAQRDYELHSLDFSTAFLQGSLHEEIWLRHLPGFTGSFPAGTQWSLRRPVYGLRQAPREWHDTLRMTLAALSTADPPLVLRTDTSLPPFYILVYVDDLVFATADTEALALVKLELQKRHTCTDLGMGLPLGGQGRVVLTGHSDASWVDDLATQRLSQGYTFSLGFGSVSWRSTRSSSVLSSTCEAEIYAGAMAAQELRWLTYLLTDLGEGPRSPPVLYVDNKDAIALCQVHRLEH
ncbi:unnamed protein product [Closterium sp. Yama58-4]|nr:unnamed protein product [Closterium sp. Yama58-4]